MEDLTTRFLRYVSFDTQSDEESGSQPSTPKQLNLLRVLRDELEARRKLVKELKAELKNLQKEIAEQ